MRLIACIQSGTVLILFCSGWPAISHGQPLVAITEQEAAVDPDFQIQGEYASAPSASDRKGVQVVALGEGDFRIVVYPGGLPGAGWNRTPATVLEEETAAVEELLANLKVSKVHRRSPTLGIPAPAGAVTLFDGTQATFESEWQPGARITQDGLLMEGALSKRSFRDLTAHLEFLLPYMPHARGQGRANSGAYYQGRYETQILDSFGLVGKNNETGGIYEIRDPDLNLCLPPLVWQTYDVDFTAARWDESGNKRRSARITVRLNGIVVQPDVEVPRRTRAAPFPETPEPGPLFLQNHRNPVRFRNIWVLPKDANPEARRPRVPGAES